jgi:SAM-dependent methyltransferase
MMTFLRLDKQHTMRASVGMQTACPLCGSLDLIDFLSIDSVPVSVGLLWPTQGEARRAPLGNIQLAFCHRCGLIHNRAFEPEKLSYAPGYEISLHHSLLYRNFMEETATRLIEQYQIQGKSVIEIGCGKGIFLRMLCQLGANHGFGFDPALAREEVESIGQTQVAFIRDYYTQQYAYLPHNLVCCRHVFNQIANPRNFLLALRRILGTQTGTVLYFELPNANYTFHDQATWNVFYERYTYFTAQTLARMFDECGFEVLQTGPCYAGGQYLSIEATPRQLERFTPQRAAAGAAASITNPDHATGPTVSTLDKRKLVGDEAYKPELPDALVMYAEHFRQKIESWKARLTEMKQAKARVVAWGSGGQGITFLNLLKTSRRVAYVVDINPERQAKFVPGSGQRVVAPEFLRTYQPDVVLITNQTYEAEIKQQVKAMGITCEFLVT